MRLDVLYMRCTLYLDEFAGLCDTECEKYSYNKLPRWRFMLIQDALQAQALLSLLSAISVLTSWCVPKRADQSFCWNPSAAFDCQCSWYEHLVESDPGKTPDFSESQEEADQAFQMPAITAGI